MIETRRDPRRDGRRPALGGSGAARVVRPARVADARPILELLLETAALSPLALLADLPDNPQALEAPLKASAGDHLLVAVAEGQAGTGALDGVVFAVRGPGPMAHTANLSIAVAAAARRQGLASALLGAAAEWAAGHGVDRLTASVAGGNGPALALFGAAGFTLEGRRPGQIRVSGDVDDEVLFGARVADLRARPGPARVVPL